MIQATGQDVVPPSFLSSLHSFHCPSHILVVVVAVVSLYIYELTCIEICMTISPTGYLTEHMNTLVQPSQTGKRQTQVVTKMSTPAKDNPARDSVARMSFVRPNLLSIRQRLSGVFSTPEVPRVRPNSTAPPHTSGVALDEGQAPIRDPYWRPLPFDRDANERTLLLVRNDRELVDIVERDTTLYSTNLPTLAKASRATMPVRVELVNKLKPEPKVVFTNVDCDLTVDMAGLEPIRFYRARPDCIFPVDCFTVRKFARGDALRLGASRFDGPNSGGADDDDHLAIKYAWKHTSMVGKGGLKLVDLRDNEVLAYYVPTVGRAFAKVKLQGSGLVSLRLVLSTILALKYRPVMRVVGSGTRPSRGPTGIGGPSPASTALSDSGTVCEGVPF